MNRLLRKVPVISLVQLLVEGDRVLAIGARAAVAVRAASVPVTLYVDLDLATVGAMMSRGEVDRIFLDVGPPRPNGDVAARSGAYALAVLSKFHGLPLFALVGEASGTEIVPESLVTAWVDGHGIKVRSGSIRPA